MKKKFLLATRSALVLLMLGLLGCHAWVPAPVVEEAGSASDAQPLLGGWLLIEAADEAPAAPIPISVDFAEEHWLSVTVELGDQPQTSQVAFSTTSDGFLVSIENGAGGYFLAKIIVDPGGQALEVQAFDLDELQEAINSGGLAGIVEPQEYDDILIQITTDPAALAAYLQSHPQLFLGPAARLTRPSP